MSSSMEIEQASSSSSSSSFPSSPVIQLGGRALDRHNPIICDGRRNSTAPNTLLTPPRDFSRPPFSPQPHHHQLIKSKKTSSKANRKTKTKIPSVKQENEEKESPHTLPSTDILKKSSFIPADIVTRSFAKLSDLVAPPPPPPAGSSRYLLESDTQSQFFDELPEIDPVYDIVPADGYKELKTEVNQDESTSSTTQAPLSQEPKPTPTKQVVVLMVSLHCKGCEGKVRKHLSKMEGVTSFNIDYAAKKSDNRRRCNTSRRFGKCIKAEACEVLDLSTANSATANSAATVTAIHLVDCSFNVSRHRNARKPALINHIL